MSGPLRNIASQLCRELFNYSYNFELVFDEQEVVLTKIGDFLYKAKISQALYLDLEGPKSGKYTVKNGVRLDYSNGIEFEPKYSFQSFGTNYDLNLNHLQLTRNVDQIIDEGEVSYNFLPNEVQIQFTLKGSICKGTILFRIIYEGNNNLNQMNFQPCFAPNFSPNYGARNFGMMPHSGFPMPHFF